MNTKSVLCVDDETNILRSLQRLLRREDYRVLTAEGGAEALDLLAREDVQVVVSDQQMPGMPGTELLTHVRELYPDIVRVILSGQADVRMIAEAVERGDVYRFMSKPWNDEELKTSMRRFLEHYALIEENRALRAMLEDASPKLNGNGAEVGQDEDELRSRRGLARQVLESLPLPVVGVDANGRIVLVNRAAKKELGVAVPDPLCAQTDAHLPAGSLAGVDACLREDVDSLPRQLSFGDKRFHARFTRVEGEDTCAIALLALRRLWS